MSLNVANHQCCAETTRIVWSPVCGILAVLPATSACRRDGRRSGCRQADAIGSDGAEIQSLASPHRTDRCRSTRRCRRGA